MSHYARAVVLALMLCCVVSNVWAQSGASASVSTGFTQPAYLGQSMTIFVYVTNLASVPMEVQGVIVNTDWYQTLTGDAPRILQAGIKSTWEFDNVQIPSTTWTGEHSFGTTVTLAFADQSGGFSNTASPVQISTNFAVSETPPPQTQVQAGYSSCTDGWCYTVAMPTAPVVQTLGELPHLNPRVNPI